MSTDVTIYSLRSDAISKPALKTWKKILVMAKNAHFIDIYMRVDGKKYGFQADLLKYITTTFEARGAIAESAECEHVYVAGHAIYDNPMLQGKPWCMLCGKEYEPEPEPDYEPGYWFKHLFNEDGSVK